MSERAAADLDAVVRATLDERELVYQSPGPGRFLVTLPGESKLQTNCWLVLGTHSLQVSAFVCRQPDENRERLWAHLLRLNARLFGVGFSIDGVGDVYLTGRLPLAVVTADELDRLLGSVLTYADEHFNTMLEIGFGSSIRREWEWRARRGESLANLQAFAAFADPDRHG
ncbi:MAG: YbjN domain-containing protein [Geodermatophilaceae bacterium]|nr:YbjN domain-containing protein [Geodermatophilaceae bacterium]